MIDQRSSNKTNASNVDWAVNATPAPVKNHTFKHQAGVFCYEA